MESNIFLSVVIPVYNGEKVIARCLNSIWNQGLDDDQYEVICVNDCSVDNTVDIIAQIRQSHSNLRLLSNSENKRAGGSRNYGVKEARGKYVVFIDADDYFHYGALDKVVRLLKNNNLDILVCDFARHEIEKPNNILVHNFESKKIMKGRDFMVENGLPFAPWKYIFKKSLMITNNCFFEENVSCEDVDWTHRIALYAEKMKYEPILLTHYILEPNSQTGAEFRKSSSVFDRVFCGYRIMQLVKLCKTEKEKQHIIKVAESTYSNAVLYFNALTISPIKKKEIIKKYVVLSEGTGLLGFAIRYPTVFSCISTLVSPLFKLSVIIKRFLCGR